MTPTKPALHDFSPSESFERPASCCRSVSDEEFPPDTETHLYDFQRVLLDARWARHKQRICSNSPVSCMPDELFSPGRPSPPDTETHLYDFQRVLLDARWARHKQRICSNSPVSCMPDELFSPGRPSP